MTLRHLRVFVAVCENGGITRAAEALHMAQPAVSTTVSELEKYYGASLFDRVNQRLILTELGGELLVKAKRILAEFEDFEQSAILGGENPRLRIGSSLTLGRTLLPRLLHVLKEEHPSLTVSFCIDKTSEIERKIECGELDLGVIEGEPCVENLKKILFGEDSLVAVCAPSYPLTEKITLKALAESPLLLREKGSASRDLLDAALFKKRLTPTPVLESVSNEAIVLFAKEGHGIAVLPEGIVAQGIVEGSLRRISVEGARFKRSHYIIMRKSKAFSGACKGALDTLIGLLPS